MAISLGITQHFQTNPNLENFRSHGGYGGLLGKIHDDFQLPCLNTGGYLHMLLRNISHLTFIFSRASRDSLWEELRTCVLFHPCDGQGSHFWIDGLEKKCWGPFQSFTILAELNLEHKRSPMLENPWKTHLNGSVSSILKRQRARGAIRWMSSGNAWKWTTRGCQVRSRRASTALGKRWL